MKNKFNILLFRYPDEAYIIEYNTGKKVIKILEKKTKTLKVLLKRNYGLDHH